MDFLPLGYNGVLYLGVPAYALALGRRTSLLKNCFDKGVNLSRDIGSDPVLDVFQRAALNSKQLQFPPSSIALSASQRILIPVELEVTVISRQHSGVRPARDIAQSRNSDLRLYQ